MDVRALEPHDAEALRSLRIRSVTEHPSAFAASVDEETALSVEQVAQQISAGPPYSYWRGLFDEDTLIGMLNLVRFQRPKVAHKTMLGGMYLLPDYQGRRLSHVLLQETIAFAATLEGVELITLAVTVGNQPARKLYLRAGFVPFGTDPRYIRVGTTYYDIEWMILELKTNTV